jgi:2-hydroxychromene-2-carboxylate isomerase
MAGMGVVTSLDSYRLAAARRRQTVRRIAVRPTFFFDLASPYTYLAAERAERMFAGLQWVPASSDALQCATFTADDERAAAARRAALLDLPLVWPLDSPLGVVGAMRVASLAVERGFGAAFVLAASRLAFCGGYDIDDPEILGEAAAAAGIEADEMLHAARDAGRDAPIREAGRELLAAGADRLPALRVGGMVFCGEDRLSAAAAAVRASA